MSKLIKDVFGFKGYTIAEKMDFGRGSRFFTKHIHPCLFSDNLFESSTSFGIPVYFLHGKFDYTASCVLAESYFHTVMAPHKKFILFEHSAHSPNIDEAAKFTATMRKIKERME